MNVPKILLVTNNPPLAKCYGGALAGSGFHVKVALDGESGLQRFQEIAPDVVVIDLKLPGLKGPEFIATLRGKLGAHETPIIALPTELHDLVSEAEVAGITKKLDRNDDPVGTLVHTVEALFQISKPKVANPRSPAAAVQECEQVLVTGVATLRVALQMATAAGIATRDFNDLFQKVHNFTEVAAVIGRKSVFQMASAIEVLVADLCRVPEQSNQSTARTIGQGIDFLDILLAGDSWSRVKLREQCQVMIIEDDDNARQLITVAMQMAGLEASSAPDADSGLVILLEKPMDLIFLDIGLPRVDGFELCKSIRALPLHNQTPIVFLTGMATFQNRVQSSLSGGNDFIGKPFHLRELGLKALYWVFKGQLG